MRNNQNITMGLRHTHNTIVHVSVKAIMVARAVNNPALK